MKFVRSFLLALLAMVAIVSVASASKPVDEKDCEVCIGVLDKFQKTATEKNIKDIEELEKMYRKECDSFTHAKEKRLCWYLGAAKDSATNILREVSRPMSMNMPSKNICNKLRKKDSAICSLRYTGASVQDHYEEKPRAPKAKPAAEKPKPKAKPAVVDFAKVPSMKVKELKAILEGWGETCSGCAEKSEFVAKINSLRSKYEGKSEL